MTVLKDELTNDPLGRGYSGMTDDAAAADLNTEYRPQYRTLDTRDLLHWGFGRAGLSKLADAANREGDYTAISDINRAKALSAYTIMTQGIEGSIDINDAAIDGLLDQLIDVGIFVAQDKTDLQTVAGTSISRAAELGVSVPGWHTVYKAREGEV